MLFTAPEFYDYCDLDMYAPDCVKPNLITGEGHGHYRGPNKTAKKDRKHFKTVNKMRKNSKRKNS